MRHTIYLLAILSTVLLAGCAPAPTDTDTTIPATGSTDTDATSPADNPNEVLDTVASITTSGDHADEVQIDWPAPNMTIQSPASVGGEAPGYWFFEANAPIEVYWSGTSLADGYITAQGNWMTGGLVPFSGSVSFSMLSGMAGSTGYMILHRANPSGMPENDAQVSIPVSF